MPGEPGRAAGTVGMEEDYGRAVPNVVIVDGDPVFVPEAPARAFFGQSVCRNKCHHAPQGCGRRRRFHLPKGLSDASNQCLTTAPYGVAYRPRRTFSGCTTNVRRLSRLSMASSLFGAD